MYILLDGPPARWRPRYYAVRIAQRLYFVIKKYKLFKSKQESNLCSVLSNINKMSHNSPKSNEKGRRSALGKVYGNPYLRTQPL